MKLPIKFKKISGHEIHAYLSDLADLRIQVFRDWPYLYEGSLEYEKKYLETYAKNPDSFIVLAIYEDKVVGAASATTLRHAEDAFKAPMIKADKNLDEWVYFGESVLLPAYRGLGIGHTFFDAREEWARSVGAKGTCFCAVIRLDDHHLRPAQARDLKPFWRARGYSELVNSVAVFSWKDIDQAEEDSKTMQIWVKQLK